MLSSFRLKQSLLRYLSIGDGAVKGIEASAFRFRRLKAAVLLTAEAV